MGSDQRNVSSPVGQVNPVPQTYFRGFGVLPFGAVRNIHPEREGSFREQSSFGVHPRTHIRGVLWYGVNRYTGWALLVAAFAWAIWLDPWSFSMREQASDIIRARHGQIMVVGMAFLQLTIAQVLTISPLPPRWTSPWLTGVGGLLYASGYGLGAPHAVSFWLITSGVLMNLIGLMSLLRASRRIDKRGLSVVLRMFCLGLLLEVVTGFIRFSPEISLFSSIGPEDGLRLRMLRLASISFFALPAITLSFQRLAEAEPQSRAARWGWIGILCGVIGIPIVLAAASFTRVELRVLLSIPANALFAGTLGGIWLALQYGCPLERWGWMLLVLGMGVGLLMGLYAFDGLFPPPRFIGNYNDLVRRSIRLAHTYCIVFGLVGIFLSHELEKNRQLQPSRR